MFWPTPHRRRTHEAAVALGSNLGDRIAHIEAALQRMRQNGLKIVKTSPLYETKPMYYEHQDTFINGICHVSCRLNVLITQLINSD